MTEPETYMHGSSYEIFIRRAFNCDRGQHGAENAYFKFLLMADIGKNYLSKPYDKQLKEVKGYLTKAVDKFLKRKPTVEEENILINIKRDIEYSSTATELVDTIRVGLDATQRYRDL